MKRILASACLVTGLVLPAGATHAGTVAADQGNCVSTRDNGGAAGARISAVAAPGFGPWLAGAIGGGIIGGDASDPACRRS